MKYQQDIRLVCDECEREAPATLEFETRVKKNSNREVAEPTRFIFVPEGWMFFLQRHYYAGSKTLCARCVEGSLRDPDDIKRIPLLERRFDS